MKKAWQYILLAVLTLILAVSVALIMEHIVMGVLNREEDREFAIEMEAYRRQAGQLPSPVPEAPISRILFSPEENDSYFL